MLTEARPSFRLDAAILTAALITGRHELEDTLCSTGARTIHCLRTACCAALLAASVALGRFPAYAHHSYAAYNMEVTQTVSGTLKEFDWIAPHAKLTVVYLDNQGGAQEVSVTTGSPAVMSRQGFTPNDFLLGSKVTMSWHPNRDGAPGGELAELKMEDGRVLHGHGAFPLITGGNPEGLPPGEGIPNVSEKPPATG